MMVTVALAGFLAGVLHVFAGPDHLAALAPLSVAAKRRSWVVGLRWGLGHSAGVIVVAALAFGFREMVDLEALGGWGERLVGASMILLGLWGLFRMSRARLHAHVHRHDGTEHVHVHAHAPDEAHEAPESHVHSHAAFWIGALHGLAGTAHVVGVLPSLALPRAVDTAGYLSAYAAGTVVAMVAFASALGFLCLRSHRWVLGGASVVCAGIGAAWILLPLFGIALP